MDVGAIFPILHAPTNSELARGSFDVLKLLADPSQLRCDVDDPTSENDRNGKRREPQERGNPCTHETKQSQARE